jgi:DNA-binding NarL/FixJ family response regulator
MTRILLIEDEANFREGLAEILRLNNYEVMTAQDGLEGVQFARETLPDIILCDIMMPELDGYEVLRELRNDSSTALIPFVFLTAKADTSSVRLGMGLGADDYLTKPFHEAELMSVIKTRLQKRAVVEAQQLRALSRNFVRREEGERRTLAQRVYGEITQPLTGLTLMLQGIRQLPFQKLDAELEKLQTMAENLLQQAKGTTEDLWPVILADLGMLPALLSLFERFSEQTQIKVNFIHRDIDRGFLPEVEITAYRVCEELLSNAARYAQVSDLTIIARVDEAMLQIEYEDQGVGFDLEQLQEAHSARGLFAIRERVYTLGGDMVILSSPGVGVRISAKFPCGDGDSGKGVTPGGITLTSDMLPRLHFSEGSSAMLAAPISAIKVMIAEENEIVRQGLIRLLETEFAILGEVDSTAQIVDAAREWQPDVLILGITMGAVSTLDFVQPAAQVCPNLRTLVLSGSSNEIYAYEALRHGASGYMLSNSSVNDLIEAVRVVARGDEYWTTALPIDTIKQRMALYQAGDPEADSYNALTSREREILKMVAQGYTSKQIAGTLSISPRTAETHRSNIAHKLGLRTQSELIRYAFRHGLVRSEG